MSVRRGDEDAWAAYGAGPPLWELERAHAPLEFPYRYLLGRKLTGAARWAGNRLLFIGLNPSTADEHELDPTLRRVAGFAMAWGFPRFEVANLFAIRATNPKRVATLSEADAIGPENDGIITEAASRADEILIGWGACSASRELEEMGRSRARHVESLIVGKALVVHLGLNANGTPKHPLYLARDTPRQPWSPR